MSFGNGPLVLNIIWEQKNEQTGLCKSFPALCFHGNSFFMILDLGTNIFRGMVLRFYHQMKEIFMKMSRAVKRGLILNAYVKWEIYQEKLEYFVMPFNIYIFVEGKPRKGVTYPSTLEYSSSKSTAVKSGKYLWLTIPYIHSQLSVITSQLYNTKT